jgi:hypothetical protein
MSFWSRAARRRNGREAGEVAAIAQVAGAVRNDDITPMCH